jgi:hypothetical protein
LDAEYPPMKPAVFQLATDSILTRGAAAVALQDGRNCATHVKRTEVIGIHHSFHIAQFWRSDEGCRRADSGTIDEHIDVGALLRGECDLIDIRDVEFYRRDASRCHISRISGAGVYFPSSGCEQAFDKGLADPPVGACHQCD